MTRISEGERVPDWLLGGRVRRRVLERLTDPEGWAALALAQEINAGQATVFEVFRALRALDALEVSTTGGYRLANDDGVGGALTRLVEAARPHGDRAVDRPPSRKRAL